MIEADRAAGVDADAAWEAFRGLGDRVQSAMDGAFGVRRLIVNRALNEVECEPLDVEGQRPIGLLEETTRVGYIEAYFDHQRWGEEALGGLAAGGGLRHPALVDDEPAEGCRTGAARCDRRRSAGLLGEGRSFRWRRIRRRSAARRR